MCFCFLELTRSSLVNVAIDSPNRIPVRIENLMRSRLWADEARAAPGTFPSMNAMLRAQLGAVGYALAWAKGAAMTPEQAIALALS